MPAGRKPKPLSETSKHWTKAEIEAKEKQEKKLESFEELKKTPPKSMSELGKKEYKRVYALLESLPLSELDKQVFIQYCELVATSEQLKYEIGLIQKEVVESLENGDLDIALDKQLTTKRNQLSTYFKEIKSHASLIGLTMESRMRLVPDSSTDEEDSFLQAFGEHV